jgi:hypothetical protein
MLTRGATYLVTVGSGVGAGTGVAILAPRRGVSID